MFQGITKVAELRLQAPLRARVSRDVGDDLITARTRGEQRGNSGRTDVEHRGIDQDVGYY